MNLTSKELKEYAVSVGAMGCGVAGADCFDGAPEGFRPRDIFHACKSVVVMFRQMPAGAILAENPIPYTHAAYKLYEEMDRLSMDMLRYCQSRGVNGVIVPADVPYLSWDEERQRGQGILSLKHAAVQAGLGIMGKSTIFINRDYGNMVYLGAILIDAELPADSKVTDLVCPDGCEICINSCAEGAIGGGTVNQKLCRSHSFIKAGRDWDLYSCSECRTQCPMRLGAGIKS